MTHGDVDGHPFDAVSTFEPEELCVSNDGDSLGIWSVVKLRFEFAGVSERDGAGIGAGAGGGV